MSNDPEIRQESSETPGSSSRLDSGLNFLTKTLKFTFALLLAAIILLLVYFITWGGFFSVEPQNAVIVLRFGKIVDCFYSGAHWHLPYPVNRFVKIETNQQFLTVDLDSAPTLNEKAPEKLTPGRDHYLITGDANIVHCSWNITYRITNPVKYYNTLEVSPQIIGSTVSGNDTAKEFLRNLFISKLIEISSTSKVDDLLSSGQALYSEKVQNSFRQAVDDADCGIAVISVTLNRISPPEATKKAFEEVTAANNTVDTLKNEAQAYKVEVENDTLAKKAETIALAENYRREVVSMIRAESNYFESIAAEYRKNPETMLTALYNAAIGDAVSAVEGDRFVLGSTDGRHKQLRLKLNPDPSASGKQEKESK